MFYLANKCASRNGGIYRCLHWLWLPADAVPKVPHLLTGQIALHYSLAPNFLNDLHPRMRMVIGYSHPLKVLLGHSLLLPLHAS